MKMKSRLKIVLMRLRSRGKEFKQRKKLQKRLQGKLLRRLLQEVMVKEKAKKQREGILSANKNTTEPLRDRNLLDKPRSSAFLQCHKCSEREPICPESILEAEISSNVSVQEDNTKYFLRLR